MFTERDWLFLFGHPRTKVLTLRLWLRFAVMLLAVVVIGFVLGFYISPYGLEWFVGTVVVVGVSVLLIAPKWLCSTHRENTDKKYHATIFTKW